MIQNTFFSGVHLKIGVDYVRRSTYRTGTTTHFFIDMPDFVLRWDILVKISCLSF